MPFKEEPSEDALKNAFYSDHDLRDMYTRDSTERRRASSHTLRKYLTAKQDRKLTGAFPKIRDAYEVFSNDDVVVAFAQQLIEAGDDVDAKLKQIAESVVIPKRVVPFAETVTA